MKEREARMVEVFFFIAIGQGGIGSGRIEAAFCLLFLDDSTTTTFEKPQCALSMISELIQARKVSFSTFWRYGSCRDACRSHALPLLLLGPSLE